MIAKITPSIFIDALQLELTAQKGNPLRGVLRDEKGSVCGTLEKNISQERERFLWTGLNDLPYGQYTIELTQGEEKMKMDLVKRI